MKSYIFAIDMTGMSITLIVAAESLLKAQNKVSDLMESIVHRYEMNLVSEQEIF